MSGETMSSISEKSGSYISGSDHHGHHVEHPHHHHHRHVHQPPHLMQTTEFDEDDEEDVDLRTSAAGTEAIIVGGQHGLGGQWVQLGQENRTSSLWETTRSFVTESLTIRYLGRCHFRLKMLLKNFVLKNTEPES